MTILTTEPSKPYLFVVAKHQVWSLPVGGSGWMVMAMLLCLFLMSATPSVFAAQLTLDDGVVVKFGENAQFAVRDRIIPGKAMVFTSAKDDSFLGQIGALPQMPGLGDWRGLRLEKSATAFGALTLEDLAIRYGGGQNEAALTVRGFSPTFKFLQITDSLLGLRTLGDAAPVITGSSFLRNLTGLEAKDTSAPSMTGSQFVGNSLLAVGNQTGTALQATGNWWGHANGPKDPIANPTGLGDEVTPLGVNFDGFLSVAPLLNPTVRLAAPAPYFDQHVILLDLGCVNATEYRIAEGNDFGSQQPFQPLLNGRTQLLFTTSNGDGRKSINAQFRDANGTLASATLSGGVLIDSQAPALALTNPAPGSLLRQPITIEAQASDEAGLALVQLYLNGQLLVSRTSAPYTYYWNTETDGD
ncbi:MAG: Ig-like domain-containing protein, partial [Candidatus Methylumidiphilus sp.]